MVDHIIPHKGNLELFWDEDNLQALCKPCHDRKTAKEGRWGKKAKFTLTDRGRGINLYTFWPKVRRRGFAQEFAEFKGGGQGLK